MELKYVCDSRIDSWSHSRHKPPTKFTSVMIGGNSGRFPSKLSEEYSLLESERSPIAAGEPLLLLNGFCVSAARSHPIYPPFSRRSCERSTWLVPGSFGAALPMRIGQPRRSVKSRTGQLSCLDQIFACLPSIGQTITPEIAAKRPVKTLTFGRLCPKISGKICF